MTLLFFQLQDTIENRNHPMYIIYISSKTSLPGLLAQSSDEIDVIN